MTARKGLGAGVMLGVYNALYGAACRGVYPAVRAGLVGVDWRWEERMGRYPALENGGGARVWMHASSVGEIRSAAVLAAALRERLPSLRLVVSAGTAAGRNTAREEMPWAEAVVQAPLDLVGAVRRALSWFDPSLFIIVETEIWPNLVLECGRRGTPVAVASARISSTSYARYRYIRPVMRYILSSVACVGAQTELDGERFLQLGLDASRARVTGDLKLDAGLEQGDPAPPAWLTRARGDRLLFVAGSTRSGEEEMIARALLEVGSPVAGRALSVVAPRHIDRCVEVLGKLADMGLDVAMKSALGSGGGSRREGPAVVVLDAMGELPALYRACDVAFVGGTLAPLGGHNLAEPAACGVPVLFGPSVESVRTVAEALLDSGGGVAVADRRALAAGLKRLLLDRGERDRMGAAALQSLEALRGTAGRTLDFFEEAGVLPRPV